MASDLDDEISSLEELLAEQESEEDEQRERFLRTQSAKSSHDHGDARAATKITRNKLRALIAKRDQQSDGE